MWRVMERLATGEAELEEIDALEKVTKQIEGHTICALGAADLANTRAFDAFSRRS